MINNAYIAVLTGEAYLPGLKALYKSLIDCNTTYPLYVVVPNDTDPNTKKQIESLNLEIIELPNLCIESSLSDLNTNTRWNNTFFKLQVFNLTQFDKIIFLDLDMIVVKNIDHLFQKPHMSCVAAGQCVNPDWTRLNSGIMVIEPSELLYNQLIECILPACTERLNAGLAYGDQDVLNYYYRNWPNHLELHLPETYNSLSPYFKDICKCYGLNNIHVIHFAEGKKPWQYTPLEAYKHIIYCILHHNIQRAIMFFKYYNYLKA